MAIITATLYNDIYIHVVLYIEKFLFYCDLLSKRLFDVDCPNSFKWFTKVW